MIAFTCFVVSAYFYFFSDLYNNEYPNSNNGTRVGTVQKIVNDARWKSSDRITWIPLKANWPIHEGDSIFSGEKSMVVVNFTDNKNIVLQTETLLVIEKIEKNVAGTGQLVSVQMPYGQLELNSMIKTEWNIKTKDQQVILKSGNANTEIQVENRKSISVQVKKGEAELNQNGEQKTLVPSNKTISIAVPPRKTTQAENLIELPKIEESLPPIVQSVVQVLPTILPMPSIQPIPSAQPEKKVDSPEIKKPQEIKKIKPRVRAKKQILVRPEPVKEEAKAPETEDEVEPNLGDDSLNNETKLKIDSNYKPPQPKVPFNGNSIYFIKGNELKINFFWARSAKATNYVLQISASPLFNSKNIANKSTENNIDVVLPTDGKFYWRVRGAYSDGVSDWSEVQSFFIKYND